MSDSRNNSSFEIVVIFPPQTQNWYKLSTNRYKIRKKNAEYLYDVQDWLPFCKQDDWFSKFSGTSKSLQHHLRELDRQMYVFVRHIEKLYSIRTLSKGYRYLSSGNLQISCGSFTRSAAPNSSWLSHPLLFYFQALHLNW